MMKVIARPQETPAAAIEKLRAVETPRHALPVLCAAIPGWNARVADWAVA